MATDREPAQRLRASASCLVAGYVLLVATFFLRHPVMLTILIPLGSLALMVGIVLWLRAVVAEARTKGML